MADLFSSHRSASNSLSYRKNARQHRFPCGQCGAVQVFSPGTKSLKCDYCGQQTEIKNTFEPILEYDFKQALVELSTAKPVTQTAHTKCHACGAQFKFEKTVHAGECPFCGSAIVAGTGKNNVINPMSLLPFLIKEDQAFEQFRNWINGLWFTPGKLKKYARGDTKMSGVYVPYWTYDSQTETSYSGLRGDVYYVTKSVRVVQNGRAMNRAKRVPKIRWTPAHGRVTRFFDDILVGASLSLPRAITDRLAPWDLEKLVPFKEHYLSGFRSEIYQVELDDGMDRAKQIMDAAICRDIAYDIGGDHQRITDIKTQHSRTTFKHLLLPIWSAAFRYRGRSYRFVVNGRTGKIAGERPLSYWKIAFATLSGLSVVAGILFWADKSGMLENTQYVAW